MPNRRTETLRRHRPRFPRGANVRHDVAITDLQARVQLRTRDNNWCNPGLKHVQLVGPSVTDITHASAPVDRARRRSRPNRTLTIATQKTIDYHTGLEEVQYVESESGPGTTHIMIFLPKHCRANKREMYDILQESFCTER